ncbi:MAG: hypothetical protein SH850_09110 [Planctomycetaceae bacterium]|nr:hypothetical protein [Planctomycetaceae bacterium]
MSSSNPDTILRETSSGRVPAPTGHDPKHPDMSPEAIAARLNMVEQLRRLCVSLRAAGAAQKIRTPVPSPAASVGEG